MAAAAAWPAVVRLRVAGARDPLVRHDVDARPLLAAAAASEPLWPEHRDGGIGMSSWSSFSTYDEG